MKTVSAQRVANTPAPDERGRIPLGQQLIAEGKLTEIDLKRILDMQLTRTLRFGELAVELGFLNESELHAALARQYSYPCLQDAGTGLSPRLFTINQPFGRQAEAIRTLRSQLMLRWFGDRHKALAMTSVDGGEGASTLAANLATSIAQLGERVLLIDANLRNPRHHLLFGLSTASGLSTLLSGGCDVEAVLTSVPSLENLTVICAGAIPPNPQELLSRVAFSYLVETAPALFDTIIIDTPPILQYADAHLITSLVGGCVLSTYRHRTRVSDIEEVKRLLSGARAEIVGAVVLD